MAALVKTLGAPAQAPAMRAACARCVASLVICLSRPLDAGAAAPAAAGGGAAAALAQPPAVSLEDLLAEPDLLENLYKCLKSGNDQAAGLAPPAVQSGPVAALTAEGVDGDDEGGGGAEVAVEMAAAAARCVAALLMLGVHNPVAAGPPPEPPTDSSTDAPTDDPNAPLWSALADLRAAIARTKRWRGVLKTSIKPVQGARRSSTRGMQTAAAQKRQAYALMALHGLLGAPAGGSSGGADAWRRREETAKALVPTEPLARRMLSDVLAVSHPDRATTVRVASWSMISLMTRRLVA